MSINIGDEVKMGEPGAPAVGCYLGQVLLPGESIPWELYRNLTNRTVEWRVPEIRECITAKKGYRILAADYSQIEIKLMAFLSQDPEMLRALNARDASGKPTDIHCYIATMVYGEKLGFTYDEMITVIKEKAPGGKQHPRFKEFKRMRSNIKTTTFGVPYGSGAKGVAERCGITEEEAQQVIDDFFKQFPVLQMWLKSQGMQAIRYGYTETPYHRKRFYPRIEDPDDPKNDVQVRQINRWAGNHPIQAASADMLKDALHRIYTALRGGDAYAEGMMKYEKHARFGNTEGPKMYYMESEPRLYDTRIILVVHDEIVVMCADKYVEPVKQIMKECMTEAYEAIIGNAIPNEIDVADEESWEKV